MLGNICRVLTCERLAGCQGGHDTEQKDRVSSPETAGREFAHGLAVYLEEPYREDPFDPNKVSPTVCTFLAVMSANLKLFCPWQLLCCP